MEGFSVRIIGGGVAGSYLAQLLAQRGVQVELIDFQKKYSKPCGDAVTLRPWISKLLEEHDVISTSVKRYSILVDGDLVSEVNFPSANWHIIDKHAFVEKLWENASRAGAKVRLGSYGTCTGCGENCLCIDARGPFAHPKRTWVITYRLLLRTYERWDPGHALIDFYPELGGLFWLFPSDSEGRVVNVGAGWLRGGVRKAIRFSLEKAESLLGRYMIVDERAAPIAVLSRIDIGGDRVFRVGEAAGFIISSAGEGNRPALESSRGFAEALLGEAPSSLHMIKKRYASSTGTLRSEVRASRISLLMAIVTPRLAGRVLRLADREFWTDYLSARLTMDRFAYHVSRISPLLVSSIRKFEV
ncbi:MAG: NAD(P)/FAD-dependent oxidoreductase [Desulfurococcales archaeon]|nr:NAD(P)/FAD-dependent oxidoreductase [Desulfurococcales archaeon]